MRGFSAPTAQDKGTVGVITALERSPGKGRQAREKFPYAVCSEGKVSKVRQTPDAPTRRVPTHKTLRTAARIRPTVTRLCTQGTPGHPFPSFQTPHSMT